MKQWWHSSLHSQSALIIQFHTYTILTSYSSDLHQVTSYLKAILQPAQQKNKLLAHLYCIIFFKYRYIISYNNNNNNNSSSSK